MEGLTQSQDLPIWNKRLFRFLPKASQESVRQGGGRGLGEKTWLPLDQLKDWDWGGEAGWKLREEFML